MRGGRLMLALGAAMLVGVGAAQISAQAVTESVHVVITGGPMAGTYDATETKGGCSTGANGPGSWGNAFSNVKAGPKEIGALSLIVPDARPRPRQAVLPAASTRFDPQQNVSS